MEQRLTLRPFPASLLQAGGAGKIGSFGYTCWGPLGPGTVTLGSGPDR